MSSSVYLVATLLEKEWQRYRAIFFVEVLTRAFLQNPCGETSVVEWVFIKIAGMHSRGAALLKKTSTREVFLTTSDFSAIFQKGLA